MFKYLAELGYLNDLDIKLVKAEKTIKEPYTDAEINMLLRKPDIKTCTFTEFRNWAIVNYLIGTGNRRRTIINVKIKDIDFEEGYILLNKTKNGRQQIIPLSNALSLLLKEYLQYRNGQPDDYLFCSVQGEQMTKNCIAIAVAKYNKQRGVNKTSLHLFRHYFAKNWILSGGDMFSLQKILGHSSLDMVKEYVNLYGSDLKKNFEVHNPLEKFSTHKQYISMR